MDIPHFLYFYCSDHHHYPSPELFSPSKPEISYPLNNNSPFFFPPQSLATTMLLLGSMDLTVLGTTPVFLPGESQGRGSLVGCHLWGRTELDTTEVTQQQQQQQVPQVSETIQNLHFHDCLISHSLMSLKFTLLYQDFLPLKTCIHTIFHCVHIPYIINLFICQWALELLLPLGYCE